MSSFFSTKLKTQRTRSQSSGSQLGHSGYITGKIDGVWQQSSKSSSTFSRMRKKRPPPISISVENGNLILTNTTPTSRVICSDPFWASSTPPTPHTTTAVCTSPWCQESRFAPAAQASTASLPWTSNPQSTTPNSVSHYCCPPTELPPCNVNTSPVELEAQTPSTPTMQMRGNGEDEQPISPPDLIPNTPQTRELAPNGKTRTEPRRLSDPRYNVPHTWPAETHDTPAVRPETPSRPPGVYMAALLPDDRDSQSQVIHRKRAESAALPLAGIKRDGAIPRTTGRSDPIHADCEARLKSKDDKISDLLRVHHLQISTLGDFIQEHMPQVRDSDNATAQWVMDILLQQQDASTYQFGPAKTSISQTQRICDLQTQVSQLEKIVSSHEKTVRKYKNKATRLAEDVEARREKAERMTAKVQEKDAQIATLNSKVAQLLNMSNLTPSLEKSLPVPASC